MSKHNISRNKGNPQKAQKVFDKLFQKSFELHQQGNNQEALKIVQTALKKFPNHYSLLANAGVFAHALNRTRLATEYLEKLIRYHPKYINGYTLLAHIYLTENTDVAIDKAIALYKKAIELDFSLYEAHSYLANSYSRKSQYELARQSHEQYLAKYPNNKLAEFNYALLLLKIGELDTGWKHYEARLMLPTREKQTTTLAQIFAPFCSQYKGEDLSGKTIVVHEEQGFGDDIQMMRYVTLLKSQKNAKKVIFACKPALKALFRFQKDIDEVVVNTELWSAPAKYLQDTDYVVYVDSLPMIFNTLIDTVPSRLPYIQADKTLEKVWKHKLPSTGFNIGLVWKGSTQHINDSRRSIGSIKMLKPLWSLRAKYPVNFISLQKGNGEEELLTLGHEQSMTILGSEIQNFADSAAVVNNLDLVICVDTAIAHLTGALNIPCWVLISDSYSDFRWLLNRDDSVWYPNSMRLFRHRQWDEAAQDLVIELERYLSERYSEQHKEGQARVILQQTVSSIHDDVKSEGDQDEQCPAFINDPGILSEITNHDSRSIKSDTRVIQKCDDKYFVELSIEAMAAIGIKKDELVDIDVVDDKIIIKASSSK